MANNKCIDVSEWQGKINFAQVKKSGIDYVILRAGFGREASQIDAEFERSYKNAKTAGLKVGVYWYSYADSVTDAKHEAEACLKVLKGKNLELPVFYDMEDGSQTGFGKATLTAMAEAFCEVIKAGGFIPGIYANLNWFTSYLDYSKLEKKYFIWLAQYNNQAELGCDIWQYSSSGKVAGVTGNVDMNIIYNEKIIKGAIPRNEKAEKVNYEAASLQALLMIANRLGIISQTIAAINNKYDTQTIKAVKQMQKFLGLTESGKVDLVFISKTYSAIVDALRVKGDIDGDGKVNIRDVTALQKQIAGIE